VRSIKEEVKMGIADDMMKITEDIATSYDVRVKALGDLVADTRKTLKGFASERKKMSKEQAKALSDFVSDLDRNVRDLLNEYSSDMKKARAAWKGMSKTLKKAREAGVMVKAEIE
jgi:phenylalanyl-tRNA synthetase alpha subunit